MGTTTSKSMGKWPWLSSVKNDPYSGYCKLCYKTFWIDGCGASQVKYMNQVYYIQVETKQIKEHLLMIEVLCKSVKVKNNIQRKIKL